MEGVAEKRTSGCKINVFLRITGRLPNGYHTLESLFLPLDSPGDSILFTRRSGTGIVFLSNDDALAGPDNIIVKAYEKYAAQTGYAPGLEVSLDKKVPYGAGLGGGSANAAVALDYLNACARQDGAAHLPPEDLQRIAATLGADVPFFLVNQPAQVRGIGDEIEVVANPFTGLHLILICPHIQVATAWAFGAWDAKDAKNASGRLTNCQGKDSSPLVRGICVQNDLVGVVFDAYPELRHVVEGLYKHNASAASMSGSGSSLFGVFEEKRDAENAMRFFLEKGERVFYHSL